LKVAEPQAVHDRILEGFPYAALERFERESQLPREVVQEVIQLPARTLARRKDSGRLSPEESERLYRLASLFSKAVELFETDVLAAREWMRTPRPALGNRTPVELAKTEVGARQVEDLIGRLGHGVFT
jgi:putative toxin-antitoxin system antitoxin component (TIGR02293 family)